MSRTANGRLAHVHEHAAALVNHEAAGPDANVPGVVIAETGGSSANCHRPQGLAVLARLRRRSTASSRRHAEPVLDRQLPRRRGAPAAPVAAPAFVCTVASILSATCRSRQLQRSLSLAPDTSTRRSSRRARQHRVPADPDVRPGQRSCTPMRSPSASRRHDSAAGVASITIRRQVRTRDTATAPVTTASATAEVLAHGPTRFCRNDRRRMPTTKRALMPPLVPDTLRT